MKVVDDPSVSGRNEEMNSLLAALSGLLKGDASVRDEGAGSNWVCTIAFLINGQDTPVSFNWNLTVKPDGCWTSEGTPLQLGGQTIHTRAGKTVTDPIYAVDGCFPAT